MEVLATFVGITIATVIGRLFQIMRGEKREREKNESKIEIAHNSLVGEVNGLKTEIDKLKTANAAKDRTITELTGQVSDLDAINKDQVRQLAALHIIEGKFNALQVNYDTLLTTIQLQSDKIETLEGRLTEVESELAQEREANSRLKGSYDDLQKKHTLLLDKAERQGAIIQYNESLWSIVGEALKDSIEKSITVEGKEDDETTRVHPT